MHMHQKDTGEKEASTLLALTSFLYAYVDYSRYGNKSFVTKVWQHNKQLVTNTCIRLAKKGSFDSNSSYIISILWSICSAHASWHLCS